MRINGSSENQAPIDPGSPRATIIILVQDQRLWGWKGPRGAPGPPRPSSYRLENCPRRAVTCLRPHTEKSPAASIIWSQPIPSGSGPEGRTPGATPHPVVPLEGAQLGGAWRGSLIVQFSSVAQLCPTLFNPMDLSTPGFPVHHQLPELAETHVHRVSDAIQPSHPLSSPSPPALNLSQHQGVFHQVTSQKSVPGKKTHQVNNQE